MKNIHFKVLLVLLVFSFYVYGQWVQTGHTNKNVNALVMHNMNLFASTDSGIYRSSDNGISWTNIFASAAVALATSGTKLYAATGSSVFSSSDNGSSWNYLNGQYGAYIYTLAAYDTNLLVGGNEVYRSTTEGATWALVLGPPGWVFDITFSSNSLGGKDLYVGVGYEETGAGRVYHSTDNGTTWTWSTNGMTTHMVYALAAFSNGTGGTNVFAGTWWEGVYLSTDYGANWTEVNTGLTNLTINCFTVYGKNIFVGTCGEGVFLTTDNGANWSQVNSGLTNKIIEDFAVSETDLFVGTLGGGVWKRPLSEMITAVNVKDYEMPTQFKLEQNYPNPFNPTTKIRYTIPSVGTSFMKFVQLKVYDMLGNEVAALVDEYKPSGSYEVEFQTEIGSRQLASGIYLYTLRIDHNVQTRKMVLIR